MKLGQKMEAGVLLKPASLISIYFLLITLDLTSTFLCSPDLKLEGNPIFNALNVKWKGLISIYLFIAILCVIGYLSGLKYINSLISKKQTQFESKQLFPLLTKDPKLLISVICIGIFYSHIINIGHVVINNLIVLLYLKDVQFFLSDAVKKYPDFQKYFRIYYQTFPILIGFLLAFIQLKKSFRISLARSKSI